MQLNRKRKHLDLKVAKIFVLTFPKKMKKWPTPVYTNVAVTGAPKLNSTMRPHFEQAWVAARVRGQGNSLYY